MAAAANTEFHPNLPPLPKRYPFLENSLISSQHASSFIMTFRSVITLANSIIGVSILAMPFCFKQCGIVLAILMIFLSGIVVKLSCHFMVKSALIARRRNYELLGTYMPAHQTTLRPWPRTNNINLLSDFFGYPMFYVKLRRCPTGELDNKQLRTVHSGWFIRAYMKLPESWSLTLLPKFHSSGPKVSLFHTIHISYYSKCTCPLSEKALEPGEAPSCRVRSHFLENMDSGILTSTSSEFDADDENCLLFTCGEATQVYGR